MIKLLKLTTLQGPEDIEKIVWLVVDKVESIQRCDSGAIVTVSSPSSLGNLRVKETPTQILSMMSAVAIVPPKKEKL